MEFWFNASANVGMRLLGSSTSWFGHLEGFVMTAMSYVWSRRYVVIPYSIMYDGQGCFSWLTGSTGTRTGTGKESTAKLFKYGGSTTRRINN